MRYVVSVVFLTALAGCFVYASAVDSLTYAVNGGFETLPEEGESPEGFRVGPVDSRTEAAGTFRFVEDARTGAHALEIIRTNTDEGFAISFDIPTLEPVSPARKLALVCWVKRIGEKSREGMPEFRHQAFTPEWTGACRKLSEAEASPYAAGWAKQAVLLEQRPDKTLKYVRFLVDVAQPGDGLVIDDVALYDVTSWPDAEVRRLVGREEEYVRERDIDRLAPAKGNLLANSSFELGLSGGWSIPGRLPHEQRKAVCDGDARHGSRCARLDFHANQSVMLAHRFVPVRIHQTHTLSAWCKAESQGAKVTLRFENGYVPDGGHPHAVQTTEPLPEGEWTRVTVSGVTLGGPANAYGLKISATGDQAGAVLVDAVQFEEGEARAYAPRQSVEAALSVEEPTGISAWDEPVSYQVAVCNYGEAALESSARLVFSDFFGRTVLERPVEARSFPPGLTVAPQEHEAPARGSLRVKAYVGEREEFDDEITLTVVPKPRHPGRYPEGRFGQHVRLEPWQLSVAKRLGACWVRLHDVERFGSWDAVQPNPDQWVWADDKVRFAHEAGLEVLGVFGRTPGWSLPLGENGKPQAGGWVQPTDLDAWATYVERTAEHYGGAIDVWEIWNEPWGGGFGGFSGGDYAELAKRTYTAAKQGNPACTVLGFCTAEAFVAFNRDAIAGGAMDACDLVSYHIYTRTGLDAYGRGEKLRELLALEEHGKRFWMSEGMGGYTRSWHSFIVDAVDDAYSRHPGAPIWTSEEAAVAGATALASVLAVDADKAFWYWSPWESASSIRPDRYTWFEYDGQLKPYAAAYAVSAHFLDDTISTGQETLGEDVKVCLFDREGAAIGVLWVEGEEQRRLGVNHEGVEFFDMMGNGLGAEDGAFALGRAPVYAVAHRISAREMLASLELR